MRGKGTARTVNPRGAGQEVRRVKGSEARMQKQMFPLAGAKSVGQIQAEARRTRAAEEGPCRPACKPPRSKIE